MKVAACFVSSSSMEWSLLASKIGVIGYVRPQYVFVINECFWKLIDTRPTHAAKWQRNDATMLFW
jgi:hypothetical protein